jgi:CopG family transcriptional regulator, nickel-responsive regulator
MERLTISMSDEFASELAVFMATNHYDNRSEAVRDLARQGLRQAHLYNGAAGECVATLSYVFNHHTRELAKRLTDAHHAHHELQVATMHVHLDHQNCLELAVLRGDSSAVREFSKAVIAERGVTHGQVSFIPVMIETEAHPHHVAGNAHHVEGHALDHHLHIHPRN